MPEIRADFPDKLEFLFKPNRYKVIFGGRGCLAGDSLIWTTQGHIPVSEFKGGMIWSLGEGGPVKAWASASEVGEPQTMFKVVLSDGSSVRVTSEHRFLTIRGWESASSLSVGCSILQPFGLLRAPLGLSGEEPQSRYDVDGPRLIRTVLGWLYHCSLDYHLNDGQPHQEEETFLDVIQGLAGALPHIDHALIHMDGQESEQRHSLLQPSFLQPNQDAPPSGEARCCGDKGSSIFGISSGLISALYVGEQLSLQKTVQPWQVQELAGCVLDFYNGQAQDETHQMLQDMLRLCVHDSSWSDNLHLNCSLNLHKIQCKIVSIKVDGAENYYDVFVPMYNNYIANGMIHHNSGKSWGVARALLILAMKSKSRILCTREIQRSIKDSVHRLLSDQIEALGLGAYFEVLQTEIRAKNGSQILFAGLANTTAESIKSFEGCNIVWVEEAQTVSSRSWEILIPTIRAPGSEIWVTFNPQEETDPTYIRFITSPPPDITAVRLNWNDNPWFPEELKKEKDYLYLVDPETADHVWGGSTRRISDAQILRGRWKVKEFEPVPGLWDGPYHGIDFGFSQDAGTMVRLWIWEGDLYLEYEAAGLEVDTDDLPPLWDEIPGARDYVARADCSRPETISAVRRAGYNRVIACKKWKGCEEDGIDHLRTYKNIVIHPRCKLAVEEAKLWSWKKDRLTGDILRVTTGKFDNTWAAARYALEPIIMFGLTNKADDIAEDDGFYAGIRSSQGWMQ